MVKDSAIAKQCEWQEEFMKNQELTMKGKVNDLKIKLKRQRDKDIKLLVEKFEADSFTLTIADEKKHQLILRYQVSFMFIKVLYCMSTNYMGLQMQSLYNSAIFTIMIFKQVGLGMPINRKPCVN